MWEIEELTIGQLLQFSSKISDELKRRLITRSANSPVGDYAEWMFSKAFGWQLENNATAGYDAVNETGERIQIKCRRLTARNSSRLLSSIRNLPDRPFDKLGGLLLNEDYSVRRAALIPFEIVQENAIYNAHVNGYRFWLSDSVWAIPTVEDVTNKVKEMESA